MDHFTHRQNVDQTEGKLLRIFVKMMVSWFIFWRICTPFSERKVKRTRMHEELLSLLRKIEVRVDKYPYTAPVLMFKSIGFFSEEQWCGCTVLSQRCTRLLPSVYWCQCCSIKCRPQLSCWALNAYEGHSVHPILVYVTNTRSTSHGLPCLGLITMPSRLWWLSQLPRHLFLLSSIFFIYYVFFLRSLVTCANLHPKSWSLILISTRPILTLTAEEGGSGSRCSIVTFLCWADQVVDLRQKITYNEAMNTTAPEARSWSMYSLRR